MLKRLMSLPFDLIRRRGLMLVLSSPSGAGKTTLSHRLLKTDSEVSLSVSVTTRTPRKGEVNGRDYTFVKRGDFDLMVKHGELLEHATVFENSYGTPRAPVEEALAKGRDVLFDIDWQGTQQLAEKARADLVSIFILPPSWKELERRLKDRAQDDLSEINHRMAKAADEMSHWAEYDYVIVNLNLDQSVEAIRSILLAERLKRYRQLGLSEFVANLKTGK
ncbi:MAG: guanylate kinase [Bdellovibrionales bacterium]